MPASELVWKMLYSADCLQDLLSGNSKSGLLYRGMEAGTVSLKTRFAVPQCPGKKSRSGDSSHGQPSAQWLPVRSVVMRQV